jgi:hypothetical protein
MATYLYLNGALDNPLTDAQLQRGFERCWKELEALLKNLPEPTSYQERRSPGDMLADVLNEVRGISRIINDVAPHLENLTSRSSYSSVVTYVDSESGQIVSLPILPKSKLYGTSLGSLAIRSIIIDTLKARQKSRKAWSILRSCKPYDSQRVLWEMMNMKKEGLITYKEPLAERSMISLVEDEQPNNSDKE